MHSPVRETVDSEFELRLAAAVPSLRAFVRRAAGRDTDDVVQEVLLRAWTYRASCRPDVDLEPWLMKIGVRVVLARRGSAQHRSLDAGTHDVGVLDQEPVDAAELARTLAALPSRERDVLLRAHRDGEPLRAIAAAYGVPVNTVKSWLHRARRRVLATGIAMVGLIAIGGGLLTIDPPPRPSGRILEYRASLEITTRTTVELCTVSDVGTTWTNRTRGPLGDVVTSHEVRALGRTR
ncbi:MAG: sigma-70 family RNA polymerase sigma factor [Planctomycetes bacterium]|nr:sigma-70 family RNA polymerase sigma factor [Planctomycetota bacterium]